MEDEYYNSITESYESCCSVCGCKLGYMYPYSKCTDCINK